MENLVYLSKKNTPITDTLKISAHFQKEHKNVLRDARKNAELLHKLFPEEGPMFHEVVLKDGQNKDRPVIVMNQQGFALLAMGFTGEEAFKFKIEFLKAFDQAQQRIKLLEAKEKTNQEYEALYLRQIEAAIGKLTRVKDVKATNREDIKKISYFDNVLACDNTVSTSLIASELGLSAQKLNAFLSHEGIIRKTSGEWALRHPYNKEGYARLKTLVIDSKSKPGCTRTIHQLHWTEKGRKFIHELWALESEKDEVLKQEMHSMSRAIA